MCVASSILRLVLATPREQRTRNNEIDDFLSRPLDTHTASRRLFALGWVDSFHLDPDYTLFICHGLDQEGTMGLRGARRCVCICIGFADTQSPPSSTFVPRHFFSASGGSLHSWDYKEVCYAWRFTFPVRDGLVRSGLGIQGVAWLGYGLFMQDAYILAHWGIIRYVDM
jgi:hypothetical protein